MRRSPVASKTARPSFVTCAVMTARCRPMSNRCWPPMPATDRSSSSSVDRAMRGQRVRRGRGRPRPPDLRAHAGRAPRNLRDHRTARRRRHGSASIGPATRRSAARSPSRSCPISGWPIPIGARVSSARRACWRRSTIPTSGRFTASTRASLRRAQGWRSKRSSWNWSKARRSPTASRSRPQPSASRRGLPIDEVVSIASQVIEALEAAHERGIVHRDLKPANIKITPEGRVKVLDFGLARAMGGTGSGPQIANSPTITVGGTQDGVLLGTAPYMSPEQARGRTVDKRTDIWAFGCVLYEMLTGAPAFAGDGVAEVLANVIKTEPDWTALPADTPAALRLCLRRCLQKDLRQRFHDIADVRLAMEGAFEQPARDERLASTRQDASYARLAYAGWAIAAAGDRRRVCDRRLRSQGACGRARNSSGDRDASGSRSAVARDFSRWPQRGFPGRTGSADGSGFGRSIRRRRGRWRAPTARSIHSGRRTAGRSRSPRVVC